MTGSEYQKLAMRTNNIDNLREMRLNAILGLNGEAGEIADMFKKGLFQGHEIKVENIILELGDILWYIALMAQSLETTIDEVMEQNIMKLGKRYPEGFDINKSLNREV